MASLSEGDRSRVGLRLVFVLCCLQKRLCISIDISFTLNSLYLFPTRFGILWQGITRDRVIPCQSCAVIGLGLVA